MPVHAQLTLAEANLFWPMLWLVAAVCGVGLGVWATLAVRRWMHAEDEVKAFTLQDLREMRSAGDITEQEFLTMRSALLGAAGAKPKPQDPRREPPADAPEALDEP